MSIFASDNLFVLETAHYHYVFGITENGLNKHIHWGGKCPVEDYSTETRLTENTALHTELDQICQELSPFGGTMYRDCSLKVTFADGCREIELDYITHSVDGNTLTLAFRDKHYPLFVGLYYTVYEDYDLIVRTVSLTNGGKAPMSVEKLMSAELPLPGTKPYHIKNTNGAWGAECMPTDAVLDGGKLVFESRRGISSHNNSPYFVAYTDADEKRGDVYFATLAYSGSFKVSVQRDLFGKTRAMLGMNDFDAEYRLKPGEKLTAPAVICGAAEGFGAMSRALNRFALDKVLPRRFAFTPLPVLYNSWEATYFDVNTKDQTAIAKVAADLGCELFVMDDGWFGARYDDRAGLGDWVVNKEKFPNGIDELIDNVNALGMDFGLWFEPEMVNPDSDLYREHPDWAYHYETRTAHTLRHQLNLNLTRQDVQDYLFDALDTMLRAHNIKYVKWDMNRAFSETGAENLDVPKEHWYRYVQAFYRLVDRLRAAHPDVQFESCSSGGGRCDWGALERFDMVWTSDNTDAIDRIVIQKGYTLTRPTKTMRAWVTDKNWYNRDTPLDFRFNIAMRGSLSLGGKLDEYTEEERETCKKYIALYKDIRHLVQFGDLWRLTDIDKDQVSADIYVAPDKREAVLFIAAVNTRCMKKPVMLRLDGLDEKKVYAFDFDGAHYEKSGAYLMNVGIQLECKVQYYNRIVKMTAE